MSFLLYQKLSVPSIPFFTGFLRGKPCAFTSLRRLPPSPIPEELFQVVKARIVANKFVSVDYIFKNKAFCRYYDKPLHSATDTYKETMQNKSIKKETLE